jgi:phospholipase/carboxylesterase
MITHDERHLAPRAARPHLHPMPLTPRATPARVFFRLSSLALLASGSLLALALIAQSLTARAETAPSPPGATLAKPPTPPGTSEIRNPRSRLLTWEVGDAKLPVVLLHGYGSQPQDWFPFVTTIKLPKGGGRFVFPSAPEPTVPPDGPLGGLGWWRLHLDTYVPAGAKLPDLSKAHPAGLVRAAGEIRTLLGEVEKRLAVHPRTAILGGFSQGGIVAAEVAFRSDVPLRALLLFSPTLVDEAAWIKAMERRRGLPVFISHGRKDDVLSYEASARLQETMQKAGLAVTWFPFDGGHEITVPVVEKLNEFLAKL